jgi:hypothetical protein
VASSYSGSRSSSRSSESTGLRLSVFIGIPLDKFVYRLEFVSMVVSQLAKLSRMEIGMGMGIG